MGWLGWSLDQTLDTPIPALLLAFKGRSEMVLAMQGVAPTVAAPAQQQPMPAAAVFGAMRSIFGGGKPGTPRASPAQQ